jgi:hypothetical protein
MAFKGTIGVCDVLYSVLSALGPQYTTTTDHRHQFFSPQQARSRSSGPGFLNRLRAAPLPCGNSLWLCMQRCRRPTKRPQQQLLRVFTSPGPLHPTCMMAQHLSARILNTSILVVGIPLLFSRLHPLHWSFSVHHVNCPLPLMIVEQLLRSFFR